MQVVIAAIIINSLFGINRFCRAGSYLRALLLLPLLPPHHPLPRSPNGSSPIRPSYFFSSLLVSISMLDAGTQMEEGAQGRRDRPRSSRRRKSIDESMCVCVCVCVYVRWKEEPSLGRIQDAAGCLVLYFSFFLSPLSYCLFQRQQPNNDVEINK